MQVWFSARHFMFISLFRRNCLVFYKMQLSHSFLRLVWCVFSPFGAFSKIFHGFLHLRFQFVNATFEHWFRHHVAAPAAPERVSGFLVVFCWSLFISTESDLKAYLTAVALNATFIFVGGFAKCLLISPMFAVALAVFSPTLVISKPHKSGWTPRLSLKVLAIKQY